MKGGKNYENIGIANFDLSGDRCNKRDHRMDCEELEKLKFGKSESASFTNPRFT